MLKIWMAAAGAVGFALLFGVRGKKLFWIAGGGAVGYGAYAFFLGMGQGVFSALLLATLLTALLSEALARIQKAPVLLFLVPMLIPLIPGGDLYYAMYSFVRGEGAAFGARVQLVLSEAAAIALGILCTASGVNVFRKILHGVRRRPFF